MMASPWSRLGGQAVNLPECATSEGPKHETDDATINSLRLRAPNATRVSCDFSRFFGRGRGCALGSLEVSSNFDYERFAIGFIENGDRYQPALSEEAQALQEYLGSSEGRIDVKELVRQQEAQRDQER